METSHNTTEISHNTKKLVLCVVLWRFNCIVHYWATVVIFLFCVMIKFTFWLSIWSHFAWPILYPIGVSLSKGAGRHQFLWHLHRTATAYGPWTFSKSASMHQRQTVHRVCEYQNYLTLPFIAKNLLKGTVHPKMKILSLITHPQAVPNL